MLQVFYWSISKKALCHRPSSLLLSVSTKNKRMHKKGYLKHGCDATASCYHAYLAELPLFQFFSLRVPFILQTSNLSYLI